MKNNMKRIPRGSYSDGSYAKMNWKQVKARFPGLNKNSDIDFDGTPNYKDCRPLDPAQDGRLGDLWKKLKGKLKERKQRKQMTKDLKKAKRYTPKPASAQRLIARKLRKLGRKVAKGVKRETKGAIRFRKRPRQRVRYVYVRRY